MISSVDDTRHIVGEGELGFNRYRQWGHLQNTFKSDTSNNEDTCVIQNVKTNERTLRQTKSISNSPHPHQHLSKHLKLPHPPIPHPIAKATRRRTCSPAQTPTTTTPTHRHQSCRITLTIHEISKHSIIHQPGQEPTTVSSRLPQTAPPSAATPNARENPTVSDKQRAIQQYMVKARF